MRNTRVRFIENNFAMLTSATVNYSSQLTAFPFTNSQSAARSKYWKPQGTFTIDSTNNTIYINDGTNKTITLTSAKYTSPSSLASHIQTKLNASSSNWTVSYVTTAGLYKFRIQNTGSVTLRLSQSTSSTWNTLGYTLTSDQTGTDFYAQVQRNHTEEYAIYDFGYQTSISFVSIIGALGETFTISNSATVYVYADNLNQWTSPAYSKQLTVTDKGIFEFLDTDTLDTQNYRYWKISIIDKTNPLGPEGLCIGLICLSDHITLSDRNIQNGFNFQLIDRSVSSEAESGRLYFDIKNKYNLISNLSIPFLEQTDKDTLLAMYERLGKTTPFFIALDPTNCITTNSYDFTKYVTFVDQPTFNHIIHSYFTMSFQLREVQ